METGTIEFGEFALDLRERRLTRDGQAIELGSRYFDALALLLARPGALVTKDHFMAEVWRGVPVTDEALTQCIRTLRRALGDTPGAPRFIATVPKHGYRFVAAVAPASHEVAVEAEGRQALPAAPRPAPGSGGIAAAGTLGGIVAGSIGGLAYGLVSLAAAPASGGEGALILIALGAVLGCLGGSGIGLGMALLARRWPQRRWALAAGGALGGMLVGALGSTLGSDGVQLLVGTTLGEVTGLFEGAVLGLAVAGAGALFAQQRSPAAALTGAALVGWLAGWVIEASGGLLLGGSLLELERGIAGSRLGLAAILTPWAGWLAPAEGAVFVATMLAAQRLAAGRERHVQRGGTIARPAPR